MIIIIIIVIIVIIIIIIFLYHYHHYHRHRCEKIKQVHIRAASWRGGKEERRTLPRTLLTKMVRIRLKTEVMTMLMMAEMVMVEMVMAEMVMVGMMMAVVTRWL